MDAAENLSRLLDAVADDPAAAAWTTWCERLDRALEAVEGVTLSAENDLEGLVVVISADFTWSHIDFGSMLVLKGVRTFTALRLQESSRILGAT